jgi:tetratricopeptide (TPR) repeat protein
MDQTISLPALKHPVAMLRFWPGHGDESWALSVAEKVAEQAGLVRLEERLFAVLPSVGGGAVFEVAIRFGSELLARLLRGGTGREISGLLVFPGEVEHRSAVYEPVAESLFEDLQRKSPYLPPQGLFLTGYAASWLMGCYRFERVDLYEAPSGRRVPFFRFLGDEVNLRPWHNPELLGRRCRVARPAVEAALGQMLAEVTRANVRGVLGCGKTHAIWHALEACGDPRLWINFGHTLLGTAEFLPRLLSQLGRLVPGASQGFETLRRSTDFAPDRALELAMDSLSRAADHLGVQPWVVCDGLQGIGVGDLALLEELLHKTPTRFLLINRLGGSLPKVLGGLSEMNIPLMTEEEASEHRRQLLLGLELDEELEERLSAVAAHNPLAFEEGLLGLLHGGRIRRVYGSFFFDGTHAGYESSAQWVRHVDAEAERLGDPWPLRMLAAAGLEAPAGHLREACGAMGLEIPLDWWQPFQDAGWLTESSSAWGSAVAFASEALRDGVLHTLPRDSVTVLRHGLGRVMSVGSSQLPADEWQAYRLMAGSPEALPSLLDFSRDSSEQASRVELFEALLSELRLHRERQGDTKTEFNLLWSLLPLGRRLGRLHELQSDLMRAVELGGGHRKRLSALLTLKAELDLERGRFEAAEEALRTALSASEGSNEKHRAKIFIRLGDLLIRRARLGEAGDMFNDLLVVVEAQGYDELTATCHYYLGNLALAEQRLEESFDHHQKALEVRRCKGFKTLSASLSALGAVSLALGDYSRALVFYGEAEEVLEGQGGKTLELSLARRGAGRALANLGNSTAAARQFRRALLACAGRDVVAEAGARLDVAASQLALGSLSLALEEARQAHFHLSLIPEISLLGDAEQLLGRILLGQRQGDTAHQHFKEALRLHKRHGDAQGTAHDYGWMLEFALVDGHREVLLETSNLLDNLLDTLARPECEEILLYRLFKAFEWLHSRSLAVPDADDYLRRACDELMRKTGFLEPERRHEFLFQIREHEELIEAATHHGISLVGM